MYRLFQQPQGKNALVRAARQLSSASEHYLATGSRAEIAKAAESGKLPAGTEVRRLTSQQVNDYKLGFHWTSAPHCLIVETNPANTQLVDGLGDIVKLLNGDIKPVLAHYNSGEEREVLDSTVQLSAARTIR